MAKYSLRNDGAKKLTANITVSDFLLLETYIGYKNPRTGRRITAGDLSAVDEVSIDERLISLIRQLETYYADRCGEPCAIKLTPHGGYRPAAPVDLNTAVGGAKKSQHRYGRGADILVTVGGKPLDVPTGAVLAENYMYLHGIRGGVGVYAAKHKHFHIDVRGSWAAWYCSYSGARCPAQGGRPVVFRAGHEAAGVVLIQRKLQRLGYDCSADGVFGAKTKAALIAYQSANGLKPDGVYGKATNKALGVFGW